MTRAKKVIDNLKSESYNSLLKDIYVDEKIVSYQVRRYIDAVERYIQLFGDDDVEIYSAPGRSEIGGNHTDHQKGKVLAAAINKDIIAVAAKTDGPIVRVVSDNQKIIEIDINDLECKKEEKETTKALVKGVLAQVKQLKYCIGGFSAYITSDVLVGAGLSSSAAFETVVAMILSGLYNQMKISDVEAALIGQHAENIYFGKPCGLMDQLASSVGSLVYIDFHNTSDPKIEKLDFDMEKLGYSLCITDTKGSHAALTNEYAAILTEMKAVAQIFDKTYLGEVCEKAFFQDIPKVRERAGDRATLRAIHFFEENKRVDHEANAIKKKDMEELLDFIKASGDSSYKFLQNVYSNADVVHQNVSIALAVSERILNNSGACRVHGGGFAGTIQAFVKNEDVEKYKEKLDEIFGPDSCSILKIRQYGGMKVL